VAARRCPSHHTHTFWQTNWLASFLYFSGGLLQAPGKSCKNLGVPIAAVAARRSSSQLVAAHRSSSPPVAACRRSGSLSPPVAARRSPGRPWQTVANKSPHILPLFPGSLGKVPRRPGRPWQSSAEAWETLASPAEAWGDPGAVIHATSIWTCDEYVCPSQPVAARRSPSQPGRPWQTLATKSPHILPLFPGDLGKVPRRPGRPWQVPQELGVSVQLFTRHPFWFAMNMFARRSPGRLWQPNRRTSFLYFWETLAKASETLAKASETLAKASATLAKASATLAKASANLAKFRKGLGNPGKASQRPRKPPRTGAAAAARRSRASPGEARRVGCKCISWILGRVYITRGEGGAGAFRSIPWGDGSWPKTSDSCEKTWGWILRGPPSLCLEREGGQRSKKNRDARNRKW